MLALNLTSALFPAFDFSKYHALSFQQLITLSSTSYIFSPCQLSLVFSVFTMCLRETFVALARTYDKRPLNNGDSRENASGIDINAPAVTASPSKENREPSSVSKTYGEDSSSDSKGASKTSAETGRGNESQEDKAEQERWAEIMENSRLLEEDNKKRDAVARAKGHVYENYYSNDDLHDYYD